MYYVNMNYLIWHIDTSKVCRMVAYLLYQENQEIRMTNPHVSKHIISPDFDRNSRLCSTKKMYYYYLLNYYYCYYYLYELLIQFYYRI